LFIVSCFSYILKDFDVVSIEFHDLAMVSHCFSSSSMVRFYDLLSMHAMTDVLLAQVPSRALPVSRALHSLVRL
jgi:hypothetical protein